MVRGKINVERENTQVEIPEAFIIDELTKEQRVQPESGYQMPHRYTYDEGEQSSSKSDASTVIIIEL